MSLNSPIDVNEGWRWLLQEILIVRHSPEHGQIGLAIPPSVFILNFFLPSLMYVRAVSLLDDALATYIDSNNLHPTNQYGTALHGKLRFLNDQSLISYSQDLHEVRNKRNAIAHISSDAEKTFNESVTWQDVEKAIDAIEVVLQSLNFVGTRPNFIFFHERTVDTYLDDGHPHPTNKDIVMTHHHCFGVKEDGVWKTQIKKSMDYFSFSASHSPTEPDV